MGRVGPVIWACILVAAIPMVTADDAGEEVPEEMTDSPQPVSTQETEESTDGQGSFACPESGSDADSVLILDMDPILVGIGVPVTDEYGPWVGVSVHPQGTGQCLLPTVREPIEYVKSVINDIRNLLTP